MSLMANDEMLSELADYLHQCEYYRNAALERQLRELLDLGVPRDRLVIEARMGRHGYDYTVRVKSDDEMWLDWQTENHGCGTHRW